MTCFLIFKRILKAPAIIIMLAAILICSLLCASLTEDDGLPSCGVVCGEDLIARSIAEKLEEDAFVICEDEDALKEELRLGNISMGIILPSDMTSRFASGDTDEMIRFIETPVTVLPSLFRYRIAAYVIEAYTPYLTSELLRELGHEITLEKMQLEIDRYLDGETEFVFTIESVDGKEIEIQSYGAKLTVLVISLFLFFALMLFALPYTEKQIKALAMRAGLKKAMFHYALPSIFFVMILFAAVCVLSIVLSDAIYSSNLAYMIKPVLVYTLFLAAISIICTALFRTNERARVPMIAVCLLSLGFCPIFADIPTILNIPKVIGHLLPPVFLYTAAENLKLCTAIAISLFASSLCALYISYKKRFNLK